MDTAFISHTACLKHQMIAGHPESAERRVVSVLEGGYALSALGSSAVAHGRALLAI